MSPVYTHVLTNQHPHLVLARSIVGVSALLLLVQVYRLGRLFGGSGVGSLATLLFATNLTFIVFASSVKDDVLYLLLLVTAMLLAWRASDESDARAAVLTGLTIGAAFVAKYFGIFALVLCVLPLLRRPWSERRRAFMLGGLMAFSACVSALALMPFLLTDTDVVFRSIIGMDTGTAAMPGGLALPTYLFVHLPNLVGWVIVIAGGIELGVRLAREPRGPLLLALAPVLILLFVGLRSGETRAYYVLPFALFLIIGACALVVRLVHATPIRRREFLAPLVVAVMSISGSAFLPGAIKYMLILDAPDARLLARDYVHARIPPRECIAITDAVVGMNFWGPPLLPIDLPDGTGAFAQASREAVNRSLGPRYRLRIEDGFSGFSDELLLDCDWLITPATSTLFDVEIGVPASVDRNEPPPGFEVESVIRALPQQQTKTWPFFVPGDYDKLREVSLGRLRREGVRGLTLFIYHRQAASAAVGN